MLNNHTWTSHGHSTVVFPISIFALNMVKCVKFKMATTKMKNVQCKRLIGPQLLKVGTNSGGGYTHKYLTD